MAYTCSSCRLIFDETHATCPRCGGNPIIKASSETDPLDVLNKLRNDCSNAHADARCSTRTAFVEQESPAEDFFARYGGAALQPESPDDPEPFFQADAVLETAATEEIILEPVPAEPIRPSRNVHFDLTSGWYRFLHILSVIPWRIVFRLAMAVAVIAGLVVLWNMRFVILGSITNFLISLIPLLLLVSGIVYLIKLMFR